MHQFLKHSRAVMRCKVPSSPQATAGECVLARADEQLQSHLYERLLGTTMYSPAPSPGSLDRLRRDFIFPATNL